MFRRQIIAVVLALLVLVTSSRAATVCVESDGSTRLEFVGATCCAEPSAPSTGGSTVGASQCSCADVPFGVTARLASRDSAWNDLASKLLAYTSAAAWSIVLDVDRPSNVRLISFTDDDGQRPHDTHPARLRC